MPRFKFVLYASVAAFLLLAVSASAPSASAGELGRWGENDDIRVRWTLVRDGIIHKVYEIEVQNLAASPRRISLETLFSDTSFGITELQNITFSEWKAVEGKCQWKPCKMQWFQRTAATYKESMGEMTLPPLGSKPKHDDFGAVETEDGTKRFRLEFDVPIQRRGGGFGSSGRVALWLDGVESCPWWSSDWTYRKRLTWTFDTTRITETLDNFPVLVRLDSSRLNFANLGYDNGQDIRFVDNDDTTELAFEVENWDDANDNALIWVGVPEVEAATATGYVWMYYGNDNCGPGEAPTMVWDENFLLVYHMDNENSSSVFDSTADNNYGDMAGDAVNEVSGRVGWAQYFGGSDDRIRSVDNIDITGTQARTVSWYGRVDSYSTLGPMLGWGDPSSGNKFAPSIYNNEFLLHCEDPNWDTDVGWDQDWHYHRVTYDGNNAEWWVDGVTRFGTGNSMAIDTTATSLYIGCDAETSYHTAEVVDEVRVSNVVRENSWYYAEYQTLIDNFVTFGGEENVSENVVLSVGFTSADNSLIDRDDDDPEGGVVLATRLQVEVQYSPPNNAIFPENVYFVIYDGVNALIDNAVADDNYIQVDDNTRRFFHTYTSTDNTLSDSQLGAWDVYVAATDNAGNYDDERTNAVFTVDDLGIPIDLTPDNAYMGYASDWDLTASGTIVRLSGSASVDNSWLYDENAGQYVLGAGNSYSQSYTITAAGGTENVYVRVRAVDSALDGENFNYYDVNDNSQYEVRVYWESDYTLVPDGSVENAIENRNYHLAFFFEDRTQEFDMATNPENFVIPSSSPQKLRLDVEDDNYWRTRTLGSPGSVDVIVVENADGLDQYEFLLRDFTGEFGYDDNGQLQFSCYVENNLLYVHQDFWDAEDSVTVFLDYGEEYDLTVINPAEERGIAKITADRDTSKEIVVGIVEPEGTYAMVWDSVAWTAWWDGGDLRVYYQDNTGNTENVVVRIYDENDSNVHQQTFTSSEWTLTWSDREENVPYAIELEITHNTLDPYNVTTNMVLAAPWTPPVVIPPSGLGPLGDLPFTWGGGIATFLVLMVALMFGARHAGFCVMTIGVILIVLGPIMGFFPTTTEAVALMAFLMVMGSIMMMTKRGD